MITYLPFLKLPAFSVILLFLLLLLSEGEITIPFLYERVNINYAEVNSTA